MDLVYGELFDRLGRERLIPVKVIYLPKILNIYKTNILTIRIVNCICALSDDSARHVDVEDWFAAQQNK